MLIVVGGGLAGLSAAITAARAGLDVTVIEAGTYPRHRVCGEFLSPEAAGYLDQLGVLPALKAQRPISIRRVQITAGNGARWEGNLPGSGLGISRYALDHALAEQARAAGVSVITGTQVKRIDGNLRDGFRVETPTATLHARAVIAAHGKRSALDKALNRAFMRQRQPYIGLKAHFCGDIPPGRVDVHAFPGGYCGISGIEGGRVNVCLLARLDVFQPCASIPAFVAWMAAQNPHLARFFAGAQIESAWLSISQVPFTPKSAVEGDILMAGDAAGMIAPLAGDGMSIALRGGMLAADGIARWCAGEIDAVALKRGYQATWRREFGGRVRLGRFLQASIFQPPVLAFGLPLMNAVPALGRYFITGTRAAA